MKNLIKIIMSIFLLVFAAGVLFAGGGTGKEVQPAEIEYWTSQTQSVRMSTIQVIVDTFQTLNPQIQITVVPVDENDMPTQVAASATAGNLPALAEFGSELALDFGAEGLLDIEETTKLIRSLGKNEFFEGALKLLESPQKGKYYAAPYHGWIQGIWYRKDWFEKAGLEPPSDWEAIEKAAKHFYKPGENQYGILVGTTAEVFSEQCFTQIAISNKARLFDEDGNLIFNSPEMKEAVEYYAKLAQYNPPGPQTWRARDYYIQGKLAMFFYSTYIMDDIALAENAAGSLTSENFPELKGADFDPELADKTGFAPIIDNKQDSSYGVIVALGIFNQDDAAKTEAAKKFIEYLFTEDAYVTFLHMSPGGMNPVRKGIASTDQYMADPRGLYKKYGKEKMGEIVSGLQSIQRFGIVKGNLIPEYGTIFSQQIIPQMIYKITQENMDIDKAMSWAESEMKKAIK